MWVAGRPGGFVLHSSDLGKTWEVQKTDVNVPANAIHFLDDKTGWLVGDLGSIMGTTDSGKTWKVLKPAASVPPRSSCTPTAPARRWMWCSLMGMAEGYFCTASSLMSAGPGDRQPEARQRRPCAPSRDASLPAAPVRIAAGRSR